MNEKQVEKEAVKIFYICDRQACEKCSPDCRHTSDAEHAVNFTKTKSGAFWESDVDGTIRTHI